MQTMSSGAKRVRLGPAPDSLLFSSRWNTVAGQLVHAPKTSTKSGNSVFGGGLKTGSSWLSLSRLTPVLPKSPVPNLWVENGVIWQLPNLLVGYELLGREHLFRLRHRIRLRGRPFELVRRQPLLGD